MQHNYLEKDDLLEEIIKIQTDPNADKTKFAIQCMLIINNLKKRPQFSGYTSNWTEDYISNSIYKMLKYIHNFDHTRISKITGQRVSTFAYLTQIAKAAFIEVINRRKNEESLIKETFQYHELDELIQMANIKMNENSSTELVDERGIKHYNLRKLEIDGVKFTSIYEMLKFLKERGDNRLKIEYPKKYTLSIAEYEQIGTLGVFEYLSLTKKSYKQKKKEVEDEFTDEEVEEFMGSLDEWGDTW